MFIVNDDQSIYATRGDIVFFTVTADDNGTPYHFQPGDILRMAIYGKKDAESCVMQKDFAVEETCERYMISLDEEDTKIGEIISKPKDYWYEVVLNPDTMPQTIIGYDEDGPKVFKLMPESEEIEDDYKPKEEDFPVVDDQLDLLSPRPVSNRAVSREIATMLTVCEKVHDAISEMYVTPEMYGAVGDGEADDTECVQDAINSGSPVMLTKSYRVTETISLDSNAVIKGNGGKIQYDGDDYLFAVTSNYDKRAKIIGVDCTGNGSNGFIKCFNDAGWGSSFFVDDCKVENFGGNAVNLVGSFSVEIRNSFIKHTQGAPFLVSTGSSIANVVKLTNTVFLGENNTSVFVDTTNLVCLICDSTTFEHGNTAVVGAFPPVFIGCWFENLQLVTTVKESNFFGCNVANCGKTIDGGDGVSLNRSTASCNQPYLASMSKANALSEVMEKDEFTVERRIVGGVYNGTYEQREMSKMTNKGMTYNVPLNLLAHSGTPNSSGALFMYKAPAFAANAMYKLTLIGITYFSDGTKQTTKSDAIMRSGVLTEYDKFDNHAEDRYAGVFGYDKGNAAFYFKNVSAGISSMDIIVEYNLVRFL